MPKEYMGTFFLGATTPCFDLEKPIDARFPTGHISEADILTVAKKFEGKQNQVPPLFSAVMVNGERAYELARKGAMAALEARPIEIYSFDVLSIALPEISFKITCSKGTYIRSIARDFGTALGSGAHLTSLRRTRIGEYQIENAVLPEKFLTNLA